MSNIGYREVVDFGTLSLKQLNDNMRALWSKVMGDIAYRDLSADARGIIEQKLTSADLRDYATIQQTNAAIALEVGRVDESVATLKVRADQIEGTVAGVAGEMSGVKQTATELTGTVASLSGDLSALGGDLGSLRGTVGGLADSVTLMGGDIVKLTRDITAIDGDISGITGDVADMLTDIMDLASGLNGVTGDVSEVRQTADALSSSVASLSGDVEGLAVSLSRVEQTAGAITSTVTGITSDLTALGADVGGLSGDLAALSGDVTALGGDLSALSGSVTILTGDVSEVKQTATEVKSTVSSLSVDVSGLSGSVSQVNQTASMLSSTVSSLNGRVSALEQTDSGVAVKLKDPSVSSTFEVKLGTSGDGRHGMQLGYSSGVSGGLYARGTSSLDLTTNGLLNISASDFVEISGGAADGWPMLSIGGWRHPEGMIGAGAHLSPISSGGYSLGTRTTGYIYRWKNVNITGSVDNSSDRRLKRDIERLEVSDLLMRLRPRRFKMIDDGENAKWRWGFVAQEAAEALAEAGLEHVEFYNDENPDHLSLCYTELIAALVDGYQRLAARLAAHGID